MDSLEKDIANSIVHMSRHSIVKTPFLKLNSSSAKVLHINPKIMKRLEVEKSRQLVRGKVVPRQAYLIDSAFDDDYNPWVRAVTPSSFQTRPVSPLKMATEKCSGIAASLQLYKMQQKQKQLIGVKNDKGSTSQIRQNITRAAQQRKGVLKKIANFRKLIYKRLEEIKHNNTSGILRLIDDGMINDFIEKNKGAAMSIDAVIYNMISAVAPTQAMNTFGDQAIGGLSSIPPDYIRPKTPNTRTFPGGFKDFGGKNRPESPAVRSKTPKTSAALPTLTPANKNKSILAVRDQLVLEGSLPSLQPEKHLSEEQLYRIATEKNGVTRVTDEILRKYRADARKYRAENTGVIEIFTPKGASKILPLTGLKAPRAIKTPAIDLIYPKSPYANGDEMGKIMASGVASGAGIPISKRYFNASEKIDYDKNGQPLETRSSLRNRLDSPLDGSDDEEDGSFASASIVLDYLNSMK